MKRHYFFIFHFIFIVGASNTFAQQTSWQWVNPLPQGNILNAIWSISSDTAVAVGDFGTIVKTTNGGRTWQVTPNAAGTIEPLYATHFIDGSTGWAVGEAGRIIKTTDAGATWFIQDAPVFRDLYSVTFVSSTVGWASGNQGTIIKTTDAGNTWSLQTSGTTSSLYTSYFQSASIGFMAGTSGIVLVTNNGGTTWTSKLTGTSQNIYGIHFISSTVGFVAGSFGLMLKTTNSGDSWIPQTSGIDVSLYALHFVNSLQGWAVGSYGVVIKTTNGGFTWFEQTSNTYNDIFSLRFTSSTTGWAVGDFGTILRTTDGGTTWMQQSSGVKNLLTAIHFPTGLFGVAVGEEGTIIRSLDGGSTWTQSPTGIYLNLYGIHMITESVGWAVGDSATILKTTTGGVTWLEQNSHTDISFYSVFFINSTTGWVVGDFGTVMKTTNGGTTWIAETTNTGSPLMRVKFLNANIGWIVGYGGDILKTTNGGLNWESQFSDTYQTLYSLDIINLNTVVSVGDFGTFVSTTDGGATWTSQNTNTGSSFYGVAFLNSSVGWCAGDDGAILKTIDGGITWSEQKTNTYNTLWEIQLIRSNNGGGFLFATGIGGTILSSGVSPLQLRMWTGTFDSLWTSAGNWSPVGVPQKGDSVYIPATAVNPVYRSLVQQINLGGLTISSGAKLTIGTGLAQIVISGDVRIDGTLQIDGNSNLEIISGGIFSFGLQGEMIPAQSTLLLTKGGQVRGSFFNLYIAESTFVQSIGNIEIRNNLTLFSDLVTRQIDTISIINPEPQGFQGFGIIQRGTIKRLIRQGSTYDYRFESPLTSLRFYPTGTLPSTVSMTVYPNTIPPGLSDTAFVRRYYAINASGGSNYLSFLSLRFDASETSIPIYDLGFFRDSSGIISNVGTTDYIDDDFVSINLDSVSRFSKWYIGKMDFQWKHPYQFTDTLVISDNGGGAGTLYFGTAPGATDGIDSDQGEIQLGPKPGTGTFDARWIIPSTNGTDLDVRDILGKSHNQIIYTGSIQPGPGGYPFTLQWDMTIFPFGSVRLEDVATSGGIFSIDMRKQNSYSITNPTVTAFRIVYTAPEYYAFNKSWNMISVPVQLFGSKKKRDIFPTAISNAFSYGTYYTVADTLTPGKGYWLKFEKADTIGIDGDPVQLDTIQVQSGWNMIGSIYSTIDASTILQIPSNIITSYFFHYNNGYETSPSILPSKAYWVKTKQAGSIVMDAAGGLQRSESAHQMDQELQPFNTITLAERNGAKQTLYFSSHLDASFDVEQYEFPPLPPADMFDVRFSSSRLLEFLHSPDTKLKIDIQSTKYPLTLTWQANESSIQSLKISDASTGKYLSTIPAGGTIRLSNPETKSITIKPEATKLVPTQFSLGQNYPNPFNPSTTIELSLPVDAIVTLKLYNVLGQEVATLLTNREYSAGVHAIDVNANDLRIIQGKGSGVYFYRISARSSQKNFTDVKKMIFIK